jgi:hypothetical protein
VFFFLPRPCWQGYNRATAFYVVGVAQLVAAPGCGLGGRGFKSHRSPQHDSSGVSGPWLETPFFVPNNGRRYLPLKYCLEFPVCFR